IGRWTTQDPLGSIGTDLNLYRYGHNNPLLNIDPSGLADKPYANSGKFLYGTTDFKATIEIEEPSLRIDVRIISEGGKGGSLPGDIYSQYLSTYPGQSFHFLLNDGLNATITANLDPSVVDATWHPTFYWQQYAEATSTGRDPKVTKPYDRPWGLDGGLQYPSTLIPNIITGPALVMNDHPGVGGSVDVKPIPDKQ